MTLDPKKASEMGKSSSRKGIKNKSTILKEEGLERMFLDHDCNPIERKILMAKEAEKEAESAKKPSEKLAWMQLAASIWKDLAGYMYPKLKAIEHRGDASSIIKVSFSNPDDL